jgi:hypothetical protein
MQCSTDSLHRNESLAGTAAAEIHTWILVETNKAWPRKVVVSELELPEPLKSILTTVSMLPGHKCLLIRRPKGNKNRIFWIDNNRAVVAVQNPQLSLSTENNVDWTSYQKPFLLVCTHGIRDRCCGTLGGMVFAKLHRRRPEWVWQCSHLGGHRFAPTVLSLPDGMLYGRVPLERCEELIYCLEEGRRWEQQFQRGDTRLSKPLQVLSMQLSKSHSDYTFEDVERSEEGRVVVTVQSPAGRDQFSLRYQSIGRIRASCEDSIKKEVGTWFVE